MQRIIKKYPNRRLYDMEQGKYITLDDIKNLVLAREDFKVIDAHSNQDITNVCLLQIIAEQETGATPLFSTTMLQEFIRFYSDKSHTMFRRYLEETLAMFTQQNAFFKQQWENYRSFWPGAVEPKDKNNSSKK